VHCLAVQCWLSSRRHEPEIQRYDTGRLAIVSEDETACGAIGANARVMVSKQDTSQHNNPQQGNSDEDNPDPALYECIQYLPEETRSVRGLFMAPGVALACRLCQLLRVSQPPAAARLDFDGRASEKREARLSRGALVLSSDDGH